MRGKIPQALNASACSILLKYGCVRVLRQIKTVSLSHRQVNLKMLAIISSQMIVAMIALLTIRIYSEILTPDQVGRIMLALGIISLSDAMYSASINQTVFYFAGKDEYLPLIIYKLNEKIWIKKILLLLLIVGLIVVEFFLNDRFILFFSNICDLFGQQLHVILNYIKASEIGLRYSYNIGLDKQVVVSFVCQLVIYFIILIIYCKIEHMRSTIMAVLNVKEHRVVYGRQIVIDAILTFCFTSLLLWRKPEINSLIIGICLSRYCSLLLAWVEVNKNYNHLGHKQPLPHEMNAYKKEYLTHLYPFLGMGLIGWISGFVDRYTIAWFGSFTTSGVYVMANGLISRPYNLLDSVLSTYFRPHLYKNTRNKQDINKIIIIWITVVCCLSLLAWIFILFFSATVVEIVLAKEFRESTQAILPDFCWILCVILLTHAFDNVLMAYAYTKKLLYVQIMVMPVIVICIALGVLNHGISGAAYGRLIAELVKLFVVIILYIHTLNTDCNHENRHSLQ